MNNEDEFFSVIFVLVISLNALWYWIKFTLKQNGYEVSWFWSHVRDIPNMWKLAKSTEKKELRRRYYLMVLGLLTILITFIASFFIFP